jgi:hypothetical protein
MNKLLGYLGIIIVLFLIFEVGFSLLNNQKEDIAQNKLENGVLVEGFEVDFETEKKLSDESLKEAAEATKDEAAENIIYTFHVCIGAKNSQCLTNLLSDNMKSQFSQENSFYVGKEGEAIYQMISNQDTITGIDSDKITTTNGVTKYTLNVHLLNNKYVDSYDVEFSNNQITSFNKIESRGQ